MRRRAGSGDYLVRLRLQAQGHREAERRRGPEIDDQIKFSRLLNREIAGVRAGPTGRSNSGLFNSAVPPPPVYRKSRRFQSMLWAHVARCLKMGPGLLDYFIATTKKQRVD